MEEYKREEKESVQYQNNLIDKTFGSMLHPIMSDQQLMQQSLHQYLQLIKNQTKPNFINKIAKYLIKPQISKHIAHQIVYYNHHIEICCQFIQVKKRVDSPNC